MAGLGNAMGGNALNWILGNTPAVTPAGVIWVSLHTADPGEEGQAGNEATGTGYAAVATTDVDWDDATTSADPATTQNTNVIQFPQAGAGGWSGGTEFDWFGIWNHATLRAAANYIAAGPIGVPKNVLEDDQLEFAVGVLGWSID